MHTVLYIFVCSSNYIQEAVGAWYFGFPWVKGRYLCLIICWICLFIVMQNSVMKYITSIGQNTGTLKQSNSVQNNPMSVDFTIPNQNLNSGSRRINGRNSCVDLVGNPSPSSKNIQSRLTHTTPLVDFIVFLYSKYLRNPTQGRF